MPVRSQPHSSWAEVYDLAYEQSFGEFYRQLTEATVKVITDRFKPPARVVDFGAGTGRLSIPLADMGFNVTAIEPCEEMLNQLRQKKQQGMLLNDICSTMQDYQGKIEFDMALCVFTVLLYLRDEDSLEKAVKAAYASLKPGGMLLIDIPNKSLFQSYSRKDHRIERTVSVTEQTDDIFIYTEDLKVTQPNGDESSYSDTFPIRYWPAQTVRHLLEKAGFVQDADLSHDFSGAGAYYWLMSKR